MLLAFDHVSKNRYGKTVQGTVYATSEDFAWVVISKRLGLKPMTLKLNVRATFNELFRRDFNKRELAKFYTSMGKRLKNGRTLLEGLEHAQEFVLDPKLRQALATMRQSILEGHDEYSSMKVAGFPERDAYAIRSTATAGRIAETFISLGLDITRSESMRRETAKTLMMPVIMMLMMYIGFYVLAVFASPKMGKFLKTIQQSSVGGHIPPFAQSYYAFVDKFNAHLWPATAIYFSIPVFLVFALRSKLARKAINHISIIRDISERSEMASLWTSFAMLYEAAVNLEMACSMLARAANRQESAMWFRSMAVSIRAGLPIEVAVVKAQFPGYVERGVKAAESSGDMVGGVKDFANDLATDVETMAERLQAGIQVGSLMLMALAVFGFFLVSYYPILSSILSKF